jgi:hypothetical protein
MITTVALMPEAGLAGRRGLKLDVVQLGFLFSDELQDQPSSVIAGLRQSR